MNKNNLKAYMNDLGFSDAHVYEDISESGAVIWHNDRTSLKFISNKDTSFIQMVVLTEQGEYLFYNAPFSSADQLTALASFLPRNESGIYRKLCQSNDEIAILIPEKEPILFRQ
ncbi:hypothetical protein SAMN02745857_04363 [Andreprevotia lacus DSM 23236]|jgi:hypothetical protein|uniref:Uncharacterized protein n=1 Tax=Andreprevotia lacus DSM 23236 TaxID=1121001 RepID=A0A1W1Y1K5_9NEIS|nr:hypothetical protein [Andreprevotia lacus]SMC30015.1 hypothetical protein SAMN02745857_04363 [Andreprevotia lacus DSM 23236]